MVQEVLPRVVGSASRIAVKLQLVEEVLPLMHMLCKKYYPRRVGSAEDLFLKSRLRLMLSVKDSQSIA